MCLQQTALSHSRSAGPRPAFAVAAALLSTGFMLAGCVTTPVARGLPGFSFEYALQNREATGLVQVFDDGRNTYLQFADWDEGGPTILDQTGNALAARRQGTYAVLTGRYDRLLVKALGSQSTVLAGPTAFRAHVSIANLEAAPSPEKVAMLAKRADLAALELRIATLEVQVTLAQAAQSTLADKLVIHFGNNSARIRVDSDTMRGIAATVRERDHVLVAGYTDATYPDALGEALARRRALNVERALLAEGVPASQLSIAYHAAGMFAVDNHSLDGKARNRRVEITAVAPAS